MRWSEVVVPLRSRAFRLQFAAEGMSFLGNAISPVALSLGLLQAGHPAGHLGLVLAAAAAPAIFFVLIGGVWADRLPRQWVIVTADLIHAVTQLLLAGAFLTGNTNLWFMVIVQFVGGAATAFDMPAATGLTTYTVPHDQFQRANSLLSLIRSLTGAAGPLVASVVVLTIGPGWALVIDSLTFVVSAVLLSLIRLGKPELATEGHNFIRELREGFRQVTSRSWIWTSILSISATQYGLTALLVLGPKLSLERDNGVVLWASIVAAWSVGEIVGDAIALTIRPERPLLVARFIELLALPIFVAFALSGDDILLIASAVLLGVSLTLPDALWLTALQQHLPNTVFSRVSSFDWLGALALVPVGFATAAALSENIGAPMTLALSAAAIVAFRVISLSMSSVRNLGQVLVPAEMSLDGEVPEDSRTDAVG
jgi:MFS family permease